MYEEEIGIFKISSWKFTVNPKI